MRPLPSFGGSFGEALSVNNAGQVAGNSNVSPSDNAHGYFYAVNRTGSMKWQASAG